MGKIVVALVVVMCMALPVSAEMFLGAEICADRATASVVLPPDSPLKVEGAEVGQLGALVLLLKGKKGKTLSQVDDLMASELGIRGSGGEQDLQWSTGTFTAFAEVVKKGYVALAVSSTDPCVGKTGGFTDESAPQVVDAAADPAPAVVPLAPTIVDQDEVPEPAAELSDNDEGENNAEFQLIGDVVHRIEAGGWVDVMGVILNSGDRSFDMATFDFGLYGESGALICVDTIVVTQLHPGQERTFRAWLRCAGYAVQTVAETRIQFAGGR